MFVKITERKRWMVYKGVYWKVLVLLIIKNLTKLPNVKDVIFGLFYT